MAYTIEYSPDTLDHFRALTARQRATVLEAVDIQLIHEPMVETRNRKPMRPNPVAPWELRIGDLRVYYDVEEAPEARVLIRAIGIKERNRVEVNDATQPLAVYVRQADAGPVVVTAEGRPVAALILLENTDLETVALSTDPEFLELIQNSRARHARHGGLSSSEMRRRLEEELQD